MLLYVPVNRLVTGGYCLAVPFDKLIPLIPVFVVPYLIGIIFWIFSIIYINLKGSQEDAKRFNLMMVMAGILSVLIYIFLPTFVNRPEIVGTDIFSNLLKLVYINDNVYNAAPSGHTFYTILCFLNLIKIIPRQKLLLSVISVFVILSTLLTKQHNILDVVIGIVFAFGIYIFVNRLHFVKTRNSSKGV